MGKRQQFTQPFKVEAVRLLERGDQPAADVARALGIRRNQLYKWQAELRAHGDHAFPGHGRRAKPADELARVKRELARVTEERDIFKKAVTDFAKGAG